MDAQQFLAEFGHIVNAPGGIGKLRELILQMAVQGKLVQQVKEEQMRFGSCTPLEVGAMTGPHLLPPNWRWMHFGQILDFQGGGQPPKHTFSAVQHDGYVQLIQIRDLGESPQPVFIPKELASKFCTPDDILVGRYGASVGKIFWGKHGSYNVALVKMVDVHDLYDRKFLFLLLKSPLGQSIFGGISRSAQDGFNKKDIEKKLIPVAPIDEQLRIVAKLNELMSLCDKLETQQQARRKLQNNLRQSTLQAVASATSPHELQTTWARLADNFGWLFHVLGDVAEIKSLILDLAIQGLLTDRYFGDEAADMLIGRSLAAKRGRLASGEMKNKKPSATDITDVEINIPSHWARASLDNLFQFIDYRGKTPTKTSSGVVLVTAKNVRPGFIATEPIEYLSESSYQEWMMRGFPRIGDLLITTEAPLGNVARIDKQPSFALAQRVIDLQPFADINTKCAMYFMMSPLFQSLLEENSTGMTAKGIKAGKLKQLLLPIPPKEEQHRIVQRVEELIKLCTVLSSQIEEAQKQSTRLAVAAVSSLTGIAIEHEEEPLVEGDTA